MKRIPIEFHQDEFELTADMQALAKALGTPHDLNEALQAVRAEEAQKRFIDYVTKAMQAQLTAVIYPH